MAGQSFIELAQNIMLGINADPIFWGVLAVVLFASYMLWQRIPGAAGGHIGMILLLSLSVLLGGVFQLLAAVMWAIAGGVFFLGLWKLVGQR